ncbi:hypothetical protein ASG17_14150 [Brevundimonas sp. Leaf363]|uniref:hypothetical protein n=1 Tax=Brevundimonas sp. Leaf363 TaxID=1736353 RepID=UPI0006F92281|nr:hypothetical protein [Brevundimonas sp. Leaf363]KQS53661.1 hypothetical protein ASG17_14150 [Brevundimonas sp. Leaf363]
MRRLLIGGDSHTVAIGRGLQKFKPEPNDIPLAVSAYKLFEFPKTQGREPFFARDGERIVWTVDTMAANWAALSGEPDLSVETLKDTTLALCMGFTTTNLLRKPDWKRYASWRLRRLKPRQLISDGLIVQMGFDFFQHTLGFFEAGRALGLEMIAVEAPPVRSDELAIAKGARAEVILDVDRIVRLAMRARLEAMGVVVLAPPADAVAETGFLKDDLRKIHRNDWHHGNQDYGLLVMRQLYDVMARLHPQGLRLVANDAA